MSSLKQKGAAQAAPHLAPSLAQSTMSLANIDSGIALHSFAPGSDLKLLDACQRRFDTVARSPAGRPNLDGLRPEDYFERKAMVVAARRGSATLGVAHYHRTPNGMTVRGLAVDPRASGQRLGSAIIALALTHGRAVFGEAALIECAVRESPGGLNEQSSRSFQRLGFRLHPESETSYLTGNYRDRHQFDSAEQDEQGAVYIRYRTMTAGTGCYERARDFLAHWSNAILPIMPKRLGR